jgi:hypothetical protein
MLNLRVEKTTIEAAQEYAENHGTSVSEIVESFLKKLASRVNKKKFVSGNLIGILKEYEGYTHKQLRELYLKGKRDG